MSEYITKQGDRIDWVCLDYYGRDDGDIVEQVWKANPELKVRHTFEAGVKVKLPALSEPSQDNNTLW